MFEVREIGHNGRVNVLVQKPSFEEACCYVADLGCVMMEDDMDYPGCADAYLKDGRVLAVQPVGFKLDNS